MWMDWMLETGFDYLSEREMEIFESGDLIGSHSTAWSDVQVYASWWVNHPLSYPLTATTNIVKMPVCKE